MSATEFGSLTLLLLVLISTAQLLAEVCSRLRQPRVVGEILAGVVWGPSVMGAFAPGVFAAVFPLSAVDEAAARDSIIVGFLYQLGLCLLMFTSGAEVKQLFRREDRRETVWLTVFGTALPFLVTILCASLLPLERLLGGADARGPLLLVIGAAFAVTSIPVISRIFHDLGIARTRFARLVLGVAVIEDIVLWAVLAVATGLAGAGTVAASGIAIHIGATVLFFACGLTLLPALVARGSRAAMTSVSGSAPVAYGVSILFAYSALASALGVNLVFAAFLAGYAVARDDRLSEATRPLITVSFAVFVPLYFALVGYQLDLSNTFSFWMLMATAAAACTVKLLSVGLGAALAGFSGRDAINLSVVLNARGGPGIVLASVAFEARIINAEFYTTLVLLAVLTSQAAGAWLEAVLRRGWPLLTETASAAVAAPTGCAPVPCGFDRDGVV
jgi:Kef-type K+ transport system membrane component KefB